MDWFGAGVNEPLIAVRAIHFGATAMTAGTVIFRTVVAKPALHAEPAAIVPATTLRATSRSSSLSASGVAAGGMPATTRSWL